MNHETLQELFVGQLRDIYDAEKQLVKTLPKIAKAAESSELADAIRSHLSETETQVSRLEEIFGMVGVAAKGKPCKGMKGLLEEGAEAIQEEEKGTLRDLTLIADAQRVEHYEVSAYGTAIAIAEQLGHHRHTRLPEQDGNGWSKPPERPSSQPGNLFHRTVGDGSVSQTVCAAHRSPPRPQTRIAPP